MSTGMTEVTDRLYDYMQSISLREPEILRQLRQETATLGGVSRMQIAPEQGQLMALLLQLMGARRYLEVGTFTGYSALACALALPPDGQVVACDVSEEWTDIARRYWAEAGMAEKIQLRLAPAVESLEALLASGEAERFDAMFIDADKAGYDAYYELGLQLVRPGGLIMIDNVLWHGSVADPADQDPSTQTIRTFNAKLHADERVSISLVTMGDGLTLACKRGSLNQG